MADKIQAQPVVKKRISRTAGKPRKPSKSSKALRIPGLKAVDTIPRLEPGQYEDGESRAMDVMLMEQFNVAFSAGGFASDLGRTLDFVIAAQIDGSGLSIGSGLREECMRILKEEVRKARHVAEIRKGVPKA